MNGLVHHTCCFSLENGQRSTQHSASNSKTWVEVRVLRIPDLKFLSTLFWLGLMGLASGAGSVALPTSFGDKGPHLKQWLVALLSVPDAFIIMFSGVFLSRKANSRKFHALLPVSAPFHHHPHHFPFSDWPSVGSCRNLRAPQALSGRQNVGVNYEIIRVAYLSIPLR